MCLSAQNVRAHNDIAHQPAKDHWDLLLEETRVIRNDMRQRRKDIFVMAAMAAEIAKWGWEQREERGRGNPQAWTRYLQTTADVEDATVEEVAQDVRDSARLAAARHINTPVIVVTAASPRDSEIIELSVAARPANRLRHNR